MSKLLDAINGLEIENICLNQSSVKVFAETGIRYLGDIDFQYSLSDQPIALYNAEVSKQGEGKVSLFGFTHEFTCEIKRPKEDAEEVLCSISAKFLSNYIAKKGYKPNGQEDLEEFAVLNVPHQQWPYWREYLQSSLMRAGFPSITLPMRRPLPQKDDVKE